MTEPNLCTRCGKPLPQGEALAGRCPFCLLQRGFESGAGNAEEAAPAIGTPDPAAIGRYRILRRIGEGGMGVVYEAEQDHPRRTVALKIIKPGMASPELLRRFEQESQALGRLQHPGIAQIYEAGTVDTGFGPQPYFAMELIRGKAPREFAESNALGTRERLEIMAKICDAVHHAHQRGLIHRDLKPGNILIDESGQPKILDFGVARVTDSDARATIQTDMGQLIGTLAYMSPEQVLADPMDIDTRSDVYSLGVILYEFLSGRLPYPISKKIHETIQSIREEDPEKLSGVNRTFRGDIETIVAKALEKDRTRRYSSAAEMAADIQRFLKDEPIVARPPSAGYQLQKFARRNRALVAGVAAVFVVLVVAVAVSAWYAERASRAETVQDELKKQALSALDRANDNGRAEAEARVRETEQRQVAEAARAEADAQKLAAQVNLYFSSIALADREWEGGNTGHADELLDVAPAALRNWEWYYLDRRNHMEDMTMAGHRAPIFTMELDPDGRRLRTVSSDFEFKDWDIRTGKETASGRFDERVSDNFGARTLEAKGRTLYSRAVSITNGSGVEIHEFRDLWTGKEVFMLPNIPPSYSIPPIPGTVRADYGPVVLSPDGSRVVAVYRKPVSVNPPYQLLSWDIRTGSELPVLGTYTVAINGLFFSPDGSKLALVQPGSTKILNSTNGQELATIEHSRDVITDMASSPDGTTIAAGSQNEGLRAWKAADGKELWFISSGHVTRVVFSADSRTIAIALTDGTIHILESTTGKEEARLYGNTGDIRALRFTPDGTQVVSAGDDKLVHIWNLRTPIPARSLDVGRIDSPSRVSSDFKTILTSSGFSLKSWDLSTGQLAFAFPSNESYRPMGISKDGTRIAFENRADGRGNAIKGCRLDLWDVRTGHEIAQLEPPHSKTADSVMPCGNHGFQISPGGDRAAIILGTGLTGGNEAFVWNVATGKVISKFDLDNALSKEFQFSADGKLAALSAELVPKNGRLTPAGLDIYDTTAGRRLVRLDVSGSWSGIFSPDNNRLLVVEGGRTITIWDAHTGLKLVSLSAAGNTGSSIKSLDFSSDGTRLVSVSNNGEVWLWDTRSGKALIPLRESSGPYATHEITVSAEKNGSQSGNSDTKAYSIFFSPEGQQITLGTVATNPRGGTIRIETWNGSPRRH